MTVTIGAVSLTNTSMANRGNYDLQPPEVLGDDGNGDPILAPFWELTWRWEWMTVAEYNTWASTILGGARSAIVTGITLPKKTDMTDKTFTHGRVWQPEAAGSPRHGQLIDVTVRITELEE